MQNNQTTAVNAAVIIMGGYSLPASVAFGALVGASLFVLRPNNYKPIHKAWLFAVSFFTGIFAGESMVQFLDWVLRWLFRILPADAGALQVNEFMASALAAAFIVITVEKVFWLIDSLRAPKLPEL
ncbi:putative holin [Neisseria sp. S1]|uniref:putative holin n=1 Tax=Neisseria sp. S1 TaxID=3318354 RepID=UPI003A8389F2